MAFRFEPELVWFLAAAGGISLFFYLIFRRVARHILRRGFARRIRKEEKAAGVTLDKMTRAALITEFEARAKEEVQTAKIVRILQGESQAFRLIKERTTGFNQNLGRIKQGKVSEISAETRKGNTFKKLNSIRGG